MTAPILKRGDIIHLSMPALDLPADATRYVVNRHNEKAKRGAEEIIYAYKELGIRVFVVTMTNCPAPTVVSIIRNELETPAQCGEAVISRETWESRR